MPQLVLCWLSFGTTGNCGPALLSWVNLLGWETTSAATATYALLWLLSLADLPVNRITTVPSLVIVAVLTVLFELLGHATLVWVQRTVTWVFGALTLIIIIMLIAGTDRSTLLHARAAPWSTSVLAMLSIIFAGTGISWATTGSD